MSRFRKSIGLRFASSLVVGTLLSIAPASAQYGGPAGSSPPPAPAEQSAAPSALDPFRDVLQRFGSFVNHPRFGEVWTPAPGVVPAGWSPYPACHWTYDREAQSWAYRDPTEWGNIVHHQGRWAFEPQTGWMWIADAAYGPGWVYWRNDARSVSWAALGPDPAQPVPTMGWQTQDPAAFNAGCRRPAPAAPVAYRQEAPAPAPAPIYGGGPAYAAYPVPVYTGEFFPGRPHGPHDHCRHSPWRPGCHRPHPHPQRPGSGLDCRTPTLVARPECNGGTKPGKPNTPPVVGGVPGKPPVVAGNKPPKPPVGGVNRPGQIGSNGNMARPIFRPGARFTGGQRFRPSFGQRPSFGAMSRGGGFRPGGFGGRPMMAPRQSFARSSFGGGQGGRGFRR